MSVVCCAPLEGRNAIADWGYNGFRQSKLCANYDDAALLLQPTAAPLHYAVCLMPFLLYDYIRCSFFALIISLICLCWRRLVDTFVVGVAFSISTYGMQHAAVFRCCLPSRLSFSLLLFVAKWLQTSSNSRRCRRRCRAGAFQIRLRMFVYMCDVRVHVCLCVCVGLHLHMQNI